MSLKRIAVVALLALMALSPQASCRMMAIAPHENVALETSTPAAAERAIRAGASLRGWVSEVVSPELVRCSLDNRGYRVVVDVYHGANKFSVRYSGSANMGYRPSSRTIHRKYNQWVANLVLDIQRAGMMMGPEPGSGGPVAVSPPESALPPSESGWSYDAQTRRGRVKLQLSEGMTPEEAKHWARENIASIVREKNVAVDAGGGAAYRSLGEHLEDGVLTVEFEAVK